MKRAPKEVHVYFPPVIFDRLKTLAQEQRRTMSAEIVIAVEERLERQAKKGSK